MLQSIESEKGDTRDIIFRGVDPKDAAGLVEALQTALFPEWLACPRRPGLAHEFYTSGSYAVKRDNIAA
jgi:hypothetical protein